MVSGSEKQVRGKVAEIKRKGRRVIVRERREGEGRS